MHKTSALAAFILVGAIGITALRAAEPETQPIAFVGHGALFDSKGNEINLTPEFARNAQSWYLDWLKSHSTPNDHKRFVDVMQSLKNGLALAPAEDIRATQAAIVWYAESLPKGTVNPKMLGILRALDYRLSLSPRAESKSLYMKWPQVVSSALKTRIFKLRSADSAKFAPTKNDGAASGQDYVAECSAAEVPIPPPIGKLESGGEIGWKSAGFLQGKDQFIVGTLAEVRTFVSDAGVCYALPRYTDDSKTEVGIDGVICLSKKTAKVCFWDNQMQGKAFSFPAGTKIPIGFPDTTINPDGLYQAGGGELEGGEGGICTDCHAGENPFVVHPRADLGNGVTWGSVQDNLPAFGPDRYVPIVPTSWPKNAASAAEEQVPSKCFSCHNKDDAGRFPSLSTELVDYCATILAQAIIRTMPPKKPGSLSTAADVIAFQALCKQN